MAMHVPRPNFPKAPAADARTITRAYISCGTHLYQVLGETPYRKNFGAMGGVLEGVSGGLYLEDAKTLKVSVLSRQQVIDECELVRAGTHDLTPAESTHGPNPSA